MKIKICGITTLEDAQMSIQEGADALGFVFYPKSKRYITPTNAQKIIQQLPPFIEKVGLFVNVDAKYINDIAQQTNITLAQIHFEPLNINFYDNLKINHIKVLRAKTQEQILELPKNEYFLIDSFVSSYGGEGQRLNLHWFDGLDCSKFILAGGLSSLNIDNVKKHNFYGVDVSSSLEQQAGIKCKQKIQEFIKKVKI